MNCIEGNVKLINQVVDLLDRLENEQYAQSLSVFNGSSLGQHFRHILDFYNCVVQFSNEEKLDYCMRERNPNVETLAAFAKNAFVDIANQLPALDEDRKIRVVTDFSSDVTEDRTEVFSTVGRELMYAHDHAVHHLAMIKMGIRLVFPEVRLDNALGVAPSTLKYRQGVSQPEG